MYLYFFSVRKLYFAVILILFDFSVFRVKLKNLYNSYLKSLRFIP